MSDSIASAPQEPSPQPRALARHLGLVPPLRWLPRLAATQTRAFGLFSRDPARTSSTRGQTTRPWRRCWQLWVALACTPTLCELTALRAMGWLASTSPHALTEVRPLSLTGGERSRLVVARVIVFLLALTTGVVAATPVFVACAVLDAWWPLALGYVVVLAPILVDQGYRARSASAGPMPPPDLSSGHVAYLISGFCADPQDGGWGSILAGQLFAAGAAGRSDAPSSQAGFVLRARTERLIGFYARFGFRLTDPQRRLMSRP